MKNVLTQADAIRVAIAQISAMPTDATFKVSGLEHEVDRTSVLKVLYDAVQAHTKSPAKTEREREKRAEKRAVVMAERRPAILAALSSSNIPLTAQEITDKVANVCAMNRNEVSYILSHDMRDELIRHDNGKNPLTYSIKTA